MKKQLLLLVVIMLPLAASAETVEIDGIFYELYSKEKIAEVCRPYYYYYYGDIVIPSNVTYKDENYRVTAVGSMAFNGCINLTSVNISNGVTIINVGAFNGCTGLTSVTIPNSVKDIRTEAFKGCTSLSSVNIPDGVTIIEVRTFQGCSSLSSITIPISVTSIYDQAFQGCSSLTSVSISNELTTIGVLAFQGCSSLTSVTIPKSVTYIGSRAFSGCSNLNAINLPTSLTEVGELAFDGTAWYESQPEGVVYIGNVLYNYKGTMPMNTSISIKEDITCIANYAFNNCNNLTSLIIPTSVTNISRGAFYGCSSLFAIVLHNSVKIIEGESFCGCSSLESISIPNSVEYIRDRAFDGCKIVNIMLKNLNTMKYNNSFSDRTYQHAMLYVPDGTWADFVYYTSWYLFNHIKEVTTEEKNLAPSNAYNLMNAESFGYYVYDPASQSVKTVKAFYKLEDGDANNCWQIVDANGGKCLYNIGADKYAKMSADGTITLSDTPVPYKMSHDDAGITIGNSTQKLGFVKDATVNVNQNIAGIGVVSADPSNSDTYYSINGQRFSEPKKGLNIMKMSNGQTKKVIVK